MIVKLTGIDTDTLGEYILSSNKYEKADKKNIDERILTF